jgi:rubrerythrin
MATDRTADILKNAILLETRGRAFYRKVAEQAETGPVKRVFETMADEEEEHVQILSDQFKSYHQNGRFREGLPESTPVRDLAAEILNGDTIARIAAAGFEAGAISAAMAMEQRAVELYSRQAEESQDPGERTLYRWLAEWETTHLEFLAEVDRAVTERIWNDNQFWPF